MVVYYTEHFLHSYSDAPVDVQKLFDRKIKLFQQNFRYPSLRAKKLQGYSDTYYFRITKSWRCFYKIRRGVVEIMDMNQHGDSHFKITG